MSFNKTTKDISPLLKHNNQSNNHGYSSILQTATEEITAVEIHRQSHSVSQSSNSAKQAKNVNKKRSKRNERNIARMQKGNSSQKKSKQTKDIDDKWSPFKIGIGRCLTKFEPCTKRLKVGYYVILINAVIVCILLIISRIFSHPSLDINKNNLFHSDIFMSDSAPLLLTANIIMMMSYSLENFLALRICLAIGCACFALWGLTNRPILLDTTMFNTVMMLLNLNHAFKLSYRHRHIFFEKSREQIYTNVFEGYMNRVDFKKLVEISYIRHCKKGEIFKTKGDEVTSLCCLVSGRISVVREVEIETVSSVKNNQKLRKAKSFNDFKENMSDIIIGNEYDSDIEYFLRNPNFVNLTHKNQFIEAPQWVAADLRPDGDRFTVSFVAVDECEYIKWPKENLIELIENNTSMKNALAGVLGLHTAHALLKSREYNKIQQSMDSNSSNNSNRKNTMTEDNDEHL